MFRPQEQPTNRRLCPKCDGSGKVMNNSVWSWGWKPCEPCKGTGYIEYAVPSQIPAIQGKPFKPRPRSIV